MRVCVYARTRVDPRNVCTCGVYVWARVFVREIASPRSRSSVRLALAMLRPRAYASGSIDRSRPCSEKRSSALSTSFSIATHTAYRILDNIIYRMFFPSLKRDSVILRYFVPLCLSFLRQSSPQGRWRVHRASPLDP